MEAKASKGGGFVLIPSRCLFLPHHIKPGEERYIKSEQPQYFLSTVCTTESVLSTPVLLFILSQQHPPFPPSIVSVWLSRGSHGYKQRCHRSLPRSHRALVVRLCGVLLVGASVSFLSRTMCAVVVSRHNPLWRTRRGRDNIEKCCLEVSVSPERTVKTSQGELKRCLQDNCPF